MTQRDLNSYDVKVVYLEFKDDLPKPGLSEKLIKKRLLKQGWEVWRGGSINIVRQKDVYPNVRRLKKNGNLEYLQYLCHVHHGMPDFICFKNNSFKFIECKLIYETLSNKQKKCIKKLKNMGFPVEIHRLVDKRTKARVAIVNHSNKEKRILERQETIGLFGKKSRILP
jgi:predicted RNA binding protein YcfA (HicA-like mRNA interferase family)